MAAMYRLRFFFDYESTCLWSANDAARAAFGYPVDPKRLPLSAGTTSEIDRLSRWFDTSLNWSYPPDPGPWRQDECDRFNRAVVTLFEQIQAELGDAFEVIFEQDELIEDPDLDAYLLDPRGFRRRS
jgi:hypothetical protein